MSKSMKITTMFFNNMTLHWSNLVSFWWKLSETNLRITEWFHWFRNDWIDLYGTTIHSILRSSTQKTICSDDFLTQNRCVCSFITELFCQKDQNLNLNLKESELIFSPSLLFVCHTMLRALLENWKEQLLVSSPIVTKNTKIQNTKYKFSNCHKNTTKYNCRLKTNVWQVGGWQKRGDISPLTISKSSRSIFLLKQY